jgi:hypothetical protein
MFAVGLLAMGISLAQETGNPPPAADQAQAAPNPVPPPAAAPKLGAADLEKLVGPIALYPDPLIATILPASVYPLEIVQAARFVADTNNLAKLDEQPWDDNVKALARVPEAIKKLNDDLPWTIQLGEAFLAQDKDVMDAIQALRLKAEKAGTLRTTDQQIVVVTNTVVETAVQQEVLIVTNTVVQIVPSNPEVIYVPVYNPAVVYYPPPAYVYNPYDPLITFGAGIAVGVIIANSCDWYHGGCYHGDYNGGHNTKIKVEGDVNIGSGNTINRGNGNRPTPYSDRGQKWQPDQSRLNRSGSAGATSARSQEARGWGNSARPSTGTAGVRPSTGAVGARPSTAAVGSGPSTGTVGARPSTGTAPSANRPSGGAGPEVIRGSPSATPSATRPSTTAGSARPSPSQGSVSRPTPSPGGGNNAFSGVGSGSSARQASSRGSMSRGGGGGRGGGGRR